MRTNSDILVAGGGPSGLAAAIQARIAGLSATVIEPNSPPIDKACGEGLMPGGLAALESLGVDVPEGHPIAGIRYVDASDPTTAASAEFPGGPGRGVRRTELHRAMWDRARELGVDFVSDRVDSIQQDGETVRAAGESGRWLIGADGLHSTVRRRLALDASIEGLSRYGIRRHYRLRPWSDHVEVWWTDGCEAYITPVGSDRIGVAILYGGDARFPELLDRFPKLRDRLGRAEAVSKARGGGAFRAGSASKQIGRCLLVGDAAGYVDALTGEGVSVGVRTAMRAVDCIRQGRPEDYETEYWCEAGPYLAGTNALLRLTRSRQIHRPMIRFLQAFPSVFGGILGFLGG